LNQQMCLNLIAHEYRAGHPLAEIKSRLAEGGFVEPVLEAAMAEFCVLIDKVREIQSPPAVAVHERRDWYPGPRDDDRTWPRLRRYLLDKRNMSEKDVTSLDEASTKIVSLLGASGDPKFSVRGLVLGYVQSGKTSNFTAVIAKAADAGYRFIIVLTGIHNSLRTQTQVRLERELVELDPSQWQPLTSKDQDFRPPPSNAAAFLGDHLNQRVLCVIKKNATILQKLTKWLKGAQRDVLPKCPTLIIDDEADQASLNTAKPEDRSRINDLLVKLLGLLPRSSYVGYTATPFANVLADPSFPAGLYPRDFIVDLPLPPNYFGAARIFGTEPADQDSVVDVDILDVVREVPEAELVHLKPLGTLDRNRFEPQLTPSLNDALQWFILSCAARRARGQLTSHMSMLIHTTVYTDVHERFAPLVEQALKELEARLDSVDLVRDLRALWKDESDRVRAGDLGEVGVSFDSLASHLSAVIKDTVVRVDNAISLNRLSYGDNPSIQVVIGGNTLSRGLTLEGLSVSFFVRASTTYDTLLQMGRWFGYRAGYSDLCRLWMTQELQDHFYHLGQVEREIREDIARYEREDITPLQFGIRIQTHSTLAVTSQMKMQHAIECNISFSGAVKQTTYFATRDAEWLQNNIDSARDLLESASKINRAETVWGRHHLWRDVPVPIIQEFLSRYLVHEKHADMQPESLSGYISAQVQDSKLLAWNVAVVSQGESARKVISWTGLMPDDQSVRLLTRSKLKGDLANVKAIMSMSDRAIDFGLSTAPVEKSAELGARTMQQWTEAVRAHPPESGRDGALSAGKDKPLLLLYPIDKDSTPSYRTGDGMGAARQPLNAVAHVVGLALVFPTSQLLTPQKWITVDLSHVPREEAPLLEDEG